MFNGRIGRDHVLQRAARQGEAIIPGGAQTLPAGVQDRYPGPFVNRGVLPITRRTGDAVELAVGRIGG